MKPQIQTKTYLLLACVVFVSACSAIKLGYNNAAAFTHTYLTSKVDFNPEQSNLLKASLVEIVEWHRTNELPVLALELKNVQNILAPQNRPFEPISTSQVQALKNTLRNSLHRTANQAAPIIASNMLGLWPNQITDIKESLERSNKKYKEERLMQNPEKRLAAATQRTADRFERWIGKPNAAQLKRIETWAQLEASNAEAKYRKRLERQQQFIALVEQASNRRIDQTTLGREIALLLNAWQEPKTPAEIQESEQRQAQAMSLIVDVLNLATPQQRVKAAERAAEWADDFQVLASNS